MMKALLAVRFRSLFAGYIARNPKNGRSGAGTAVLFGFLYLYLGAVMCGMSAFLFYTLAEPYHLAGLDWLYFAMAGMMSLGISVIGGIFTTQNQLYVAKDNPLLLSMPIPPRKILLSRLIPLLIMDLVFIAVIMVPAMVVYAVFVAFEPLWLVMQILCVLAVTLLAQALCGILGWLLHLLLTKLNKSLASVVYLVLFLVAYFGIYSNANRILSGLITNSQAIAGVVSGWIWPIYAMGKGCTGEIWMGLAFVGICAALFGLLYLVLSATFLRSATMSEHSRKRRKLSLASVKTRPAALAITHKELGKFLSSPVYLTNMGLGILLTAALAVAGIIFRSKVQPLLSIMMLPSDMTALLVCALLSFLISTMAVSTPSVSLEGKNIWILKSLPLSPSTILNAKLRLHCVLTIPVSALTGLVLSLVYGAPVFPALLCALLCALLALTNGLLGMVAGLKWARLDYINDAYPCKQSVSVAVSMFGMMGLLLGLGLLYGFVLMEHLSAGWFMALSALLLGLLCFGLYRLLHSWGAKKWDQL